jgi:hypothetical protein
MQHTPRRLAPRPWTAAIAAPLLAVALVGGPPAAAFAESKSAPLAKELAQALEKAQLDSIAAPDPADPSAFVAALYIPGMQLLVVSAKYSAPTLLTDRITKKEYRDVYVDLHAASIAGTKVFVQDQNADGLMMKADGDNPGDGWDENNKSLMFEGDRKAKMSEAEYGKVFADADERYSKMLTVLIAQLKPKTN